MDKLPQTIKKQYLVEKRNALNDLRAHDLSLQQLRLLSVYLSKINARDLSTRMVRFPLEDFERILGVERVKTDCLSELLNKLITQTVCIPLGAPDLSDGFEAFVLFNRAKVSRDDSGEWYVEIEAHESILKLMFNFQREYFTYELWNILNLKSTNQIRMFEILKQHEFQKQLVIEIDLLQDLIGIEKDEYPRYQSFKTRVLDACRDALQENTSIKFSYRIHHEKGHGKKASTLMFSIEKNTDYKNPITLEEFLQLPDKQKDTADAKAISLGIPIECLDDERFVREIFVVAETMKKRFGTDFQYQTLKLIRKMIHLMWDSDPSSGAEEFTLKHVDYLEEVCGKIVGLGQHVHSPIGYIKFLIDLDLLFKYTQEGLGKMGYQPGTKALTAYKKAMKEIDAAGAQAGQNPPEKKNRFNNCLSRKNDYDEWERMELELLKASMGSKS